MLQKRKVCDERISKRGLELMDPIMKGMMDKYQKEMKVHEHELEFLEKEKDLEDNFEEIERAYKSNSDNFQSYQMYNHTMITKIATLRKKKEFLEEFIRKELIKNMRDDEESGKL